MCLLFCLQGARSLVQRLLRFPPRSVSCAPTPFEPVAPQGVGGVSAGHVKWAGFGEGGWKVVPALPPSLGVTLSPPLLPAASHSGEKAVPTLPPFTIGPEVKIEDLGE